MSDVGPVTDAILVAENLHHSYEGGVVGLAGLSLTVSRGKRLAIVGANGAGKTTLLLNLNGTLRPRSGRIVINGAEGEYSRRGLTTWRQQVGIVFQNPDDQLFAGTVAQDISFGPLNLGLSEDEARERVAEALAALDIVELAERPTHQLSYGQKKRVAIAGSVAMRPQVLVLDEPTAGLDPSGAEHLIEVLARLHAAGTTLIIATHDMSMVYDWADEVAVLRRGAIVAQGDPATVMSDEPMLRESGLRMPWVLEISLALREIGLLSADAPLPRWRGELVDALRSGSAAQGPAHVDARPLR